MTLGGGQDLAGRVNMGGGEFFFTYWLSSHKRFLRNLGPGVEYRGEAGTTPVFAQAQGLPYNLSRPLVYMNMGLVGAQYRGPRNQYAALNYHGYFRVSHVTFDATLPLGQRGRPTWPAVAGLYTNATKPFCELG